MYKLLVTIQNRYVQWDYPKSREILFFTVQNLVYLQFAFTSYTMGKFNEILLTGRGSQQLLTAPRKKNT